MFCFRELSALRAPIDEIQREFDAGKEIDSLDLHSVENATDVFNEVRFFILHYCIVSVSTKIFSNKNLHYGSKAKEPPIIILKHFLYSLYFSITTKEKSIPAPKLP